MLLQSRWAELFLEENIMRMLLLAVCFACVGLAEASPVAPAGPNIVGGATVAPLRGVYEISLTANAPIADPYLGADVVVTFTRPDASTVAVDGFYDDVVDGKPVFKARAYCDRPGTWSWACASSIAGLGGQTGSFTVAASTLPGKLRKHPADPHQFAYDIGDTGYRYVVDTEPEWQAYIDQAAQMGATKIRTWFCRSRSGVEALFTVDRSALNLAYWQEIDRRLQYALNHHPGIVFQIIPYGEDTAELLRYGQGDAMSKFAARYAQARLSAFPNVTWCISNDRTIVPDGGVVGDDMPAAVINAIAQDMVAREPWGTLLTNHQARNTGYSFTSATWSDITTLETLDQVNGTLLLQYRELCNDPVVNEEDRYELYRPPTHPAYYFRRLMWGSLLSGGHATYCGARTYEAYNGSNSGVRGYYDLKAAGILSGGADQFVHIRKFFDDAKITLAGMQPADALAGGNPGAAKVISGDRAVIAYLPNADSETPGTANVAATNAACVLQLPAGEWRLRWFNPQTGNWFDDPMPDASGADAPRTWTAPFAGDALLLAVRPGFAVSGSGSLHPTQVGEEIVLRVNGAGATNTLSYQWYLNGQAIAGATQDTYRVVSVTMADGGSYSCVVSDTVATYETEPVVVRVVASLPATGTLGLVVLVVLGAMGGAGMRFRKAL
jgi:hypothetical protein